MHKNPNNRCIRDIGYDYRSVGFLHEGALSMTRDIRRPGQDTCDVDDQLPDFVAIERRKKWKEVRNYLILLTAVIGIVVITAILTAK